MALINGPDIIDAPAKLAIPPGVYDVMVEGIPEIKGNKAGDGENMVLIMNIINNAEHDGKKLFEHLPISGSAKSKPFRDVRLHHVLKCFGFDLHGQINTDDLAGRVGRVVVKEELQVDKVTKAQTMRTVIDTFMPVGGESITGPSTPKNLDSVLGSAIES